MPMESASLTSLTQCMNACDGDQACVKACEDSFVAQGGKVFIDPQGGKVFTDPQGGKVFADPQGGTVYSKARGGKVF